MRVYYTDQERDYLAARLCDRTDVTDRELTAAFAAWVNEIPSAPRKSPPRSHSRLVAGAHARRQREQEVEARPLVTWGGSGVQIAARRRGA
jgi:hypothetical protein